MLITETEIMVLRSLHLQGHMGKCGAMNVDKRRNLLRGLISKKLLNENISLTELGIELSKGV